MGLLNHCWKGSGQKQVHVVLSGPKTGTFYNQFKNAPYEPCHWSKAHCTCFRSDKAEVHPSLYTLIDFQLFFFSYFSQPEALHNSILCSPYQCRRTGGPSPPSTPHTTPYEQHIYVSAYTPPPSHIDTMYQYQFAPWPQTAVRQLHPTAK